MHRNRGLWPSEPPPFLHHWFYKVHVRPLNIKIIYISICDDSIAFKLHVPPIVWVYVELFHRHHIVLYTSVPATASRPGRQQLTGAERWIFPKWLMLQRRVFTDMCLVCQDQVSGIHVRGVAWVYTLPRHWLNFSMSIA